MSAAERGELDPTSLFDQGLLEQMRQACRPVALGVLAHVIDRVGYVEVRGVMATDPRLPGAVGRWLDRLPRDRTVIVSAVVSDRLAGMLERRGFWPTHWWDPALGAWDVGAFVREPGDNKGGL